MLWFTHSRRSDGINENRVYLEIVLDTSQKFDRVRSQFNSIIFARVKKSSTGIVMVWSPCHTFYLHAFTSTIINSIREGSVGKARLSSILTQHDAAHTPRSQSIFL